MRLLGLLVVVLAVPGFAQDAVSAGKAAVGAVLSGYAANPFAQVPDTGKPLPATGKWSMRGGRPESCPHDDTPCVRVVYTVPEAHVACEWTVVPKQGATRAVFLDQNEDASRYFLRTSFSKDDAPRPLTKAQPEYPALVRAAHVSGTVAVRVIVSEDGRVAKVIAVSGPPMLRGLAEDAAKKYTFQPLRVGTQAAPFSFVLETTFTLGAAPPNCTKENPCTTLPNGTVTQDR